MGENEQMEGQSIVTTPTIYVICCIIFSISNKLKMNMIIKILTVVKVIVSVMISF